MAANTAVLEGFHTDAMHSRVPPAGIDRALEWMRLEYTLLLFIFDFHGKLILIRAIYPNGDKDKEEG